MKKHAIFYFGVLPIVFFVGFGCHADHSPVLPADIQTLDIEGHPQKLSASPLPDQYLAACFDTDQVAVFSLSKLAVTQTLEVQKGPSRLIFDRESKTVYCLHTKENAVALLGGDPLHVRKSLGTGSISLAGAAVRPGKRELWICDGTASVYVLVLPGLQLKERIGVGRYPQHIAFTADGAKAYVTLKGENAVAVIDAATMQKVSAFKTGIYPSDITMVGTTACISNFGSHTISLMDTAGNTAVASIRVREEPNSLAVLGRTLWVSCEKSYRLMAVDVSKKNVLGSVKLGFYPGQILAIGPDQLLVADSRNNRVAVVRVKNNP